MIKDPTDKTIESLTTYLYQLADNTPDVAPGDPTLVGYNGIITGMTAAIAIVAGTNGPMAFNDLCDAGKDIAQATMTRLAEEHARHDAG